MTDITSLKYWPAHVGELSCGKHHLPFRMHWEKRRANIHMPRSVQYPVVGFILPVLFLDICLLLQQVYCTERAGRNSSSMSSDRLPSVKPSRTEEMKEGGLELRCCCLCPRRKSRCVHQSAPLCSRPQCCRVSLSEPCAAGHMREMEPEHRSPGETCRHL